MRTLSPLAFFSLVLVFCAGCGGKNDKAPAVFPRSAEASLPVQAPIGCFSVDSILRLPNARAVISALHLADDSCGLRVVDTLVMRNRYDLLDLLKVDGATAERLGHEVFGQLRSCNGILFDYLDRARNSQVMKYATFELRLALPDSLKSIRTADVATVIPDSCATEYRRVIDVMIERANKLER